MSIKDIIVLHNIKKGDAIQLRKKIIGMVDHYVLFIGFRGNQPVFTANYNGGVKEVSSSEINHYLRFLSPSAIFRFPGNDDQRKFAVQRALMRLGEKAYDYIKNNCESYKNWVHYGVNYSKQAEVAAKTSTGLGIATSIAALSTGSKKMGALGVGLLVVGAVINNKLKE